MTLKPFFIACLVALILLTAAVLKWVDPSPQAPLFYFIIGGLEALLALALLLYGKSWRVWIVLLLVVAVWMGFSLYTTLFSLPCSCMGGSLTLPRGMSLGLNALMFLGSLHVLHRHPAQPVSFKRLSSFLCLFFIAGFILSVIYYNQILI